MFKHVIYYQKLVPETVGKNISAKVWCCVWWMLCFVKALKHVDFHANTIDEIK